ncbi:MAG: PotD/PotF family extracellular solute-binding protein [Bacteriovoracia bacterium]
MKQARNFVVVALVSALYACSGTPPPNPLIIATWPGYQVLELNESFTRQTGIPVSVRIYESNEELIAKLKAGIGNYDVIVPSDYAVSTLIREGLILPLRRESLPFLGIDPRFLDRTFDPGNQYSIPFAWGVTGIAYRHDLWPAGVASWSDLFGNPRLHDRFTILNDSREALGAALKAQGNSLNATKREALERATERLIASRRAAKGLIMDATDLLASGEIVAAHAYSNDATRAARVSGKPIRFSVPREGATRWTDSLAIPMGSRQVEAAYRWIRFMYEPRHNLTFVDATSVGAVLLDTQKNLSPENRRNPTIVPARDFGKDLEEIKDLGESQTTWDRAWKRVQIGY